MYISICFIFSVLEVFPVAVVSIINLRHFRFDLEVAKKISFTHLHSVQQM